MIKKQILKKLKDNGVKIIDINSVFIDDNSIIGKNVTIYPNNYIINSIIGENSILEENNHIDNCTIGNNNFISNSYMKNSSLLDNNNIGPFSRLREANIMCGTKIGNFVEIKKSKIHDGVKISHLAYVGDAEIGENTNIGCGVVFCNYNGKEKFKTLIGKNCFIGSNCNLVAPVIIGNNSFIAAGCTIYKNIEDNKFVISSRELNIKEDYKKIHLKKKDS